MKILIEKPPIWEEAHKHFEIDDKATIYTWGDTIYNPANILIRQEFIEHESMHTKQQEAVGGPEIWWKKIFEDPVFRGQQEAEAYGKQHAYICTLTKKRDERARHLHELAIILSSPMYKVGIGHGEAIKMIRQESLKKFNFE